jgi:Restriction endonuclease
VPEVIKKPVDAEVHAAAWMRGLGFFDARETTLSSDAGIDVLSSEAVAQVKFNAKQVGRPELQSFVGAAHPHPEKLRLFFSWKGYSANALEYAEQAKIALFAYELDGRFMPVNAYAHALYGSEPVAAAWPVYAPAGSGASWWTPRRIVQAIFGVVLLGVVVFFITHPDFFIQVLVFACFVFLAWGWLGASKPKKGRRRTNRRR